MQEIKQVMMSEDRSRRAEIFMKNDVWHVNMIIGDQIIECRPMVSNGTVHSLHYAEDAAENWCMGIIN